MDHQPDKLAILRLSALGDCVLLVPTIRRIQKFWPDTEITWIIDETFYPLLKGVEGVRFIPIRKPKNWKDYRALRRQFQIERFDVLLAMQASFRANLIYPSIKAPLKIGFDKQRARDLHGLFINQRIPVAQEHLLEGFQRFADVLGLPPCDPEWNIGLPEESINWANQQMPSDKWIAINPAASKLERTPYPEFYIRAIDQIQQQYACNIVLTGGPAGWEVDMSNEITQGCSHPTLNLTGKTTLTQLAAVLQKADVLIAPDTGPAHIANAFCTPVIGLYAVAPPTLSAPYLSRDLVINKFPQAVRQFLQKDPETIPWGTRVHDREAMGLFQVDEVLSKLQGLMLDK
jgi:heptosyltransferase I